MATCFDRWEKDPFFSAADEVQDSADRMESVYRRWIHEIKRDAAGPSDEARRELNTTLGTAKWQLEEFERAVTANDEACAAGEETRVRHSQFVVAIGSRISAVENSLKKYNLEQGSELTWVKLDEGERDELALFLSCTSSLREKAVVVPSVESGTKLGTNEKNKAIDSKDSCQPNETGKRGEEGVKGHRRTASASPDIESWKILVSGEDDEWPNRPPPKVPSFSCLSKAVETASKVKWPKNGFSKCKGGDQHDAEESIPLQNYKWNRGMNVCYEKSKSCLSTCGEETYDKELYGWLGALHRQLQRSQYQIQYGRSFQTFFWAVTVVILIVLLAFHAI